MFSCYGISAFITFKPTPILLIKHTAVVAKHLCQGVFLITNPMKQLETLPYTNIIFKTK